MKRFTLPAWPAAFFLITLTIQLPAIAQEGRLEEIQIHSKGLEANLLDDSPTRNVTVYLPHECGTKPDKRYPVVYLLHGYSGKNTLWTGGGYVEHLNIVAIADKLIATGTIEPMILVAPDCHNEYGGSWYTNSPVTGNWEDFVTKDLIQHIDAKYRTIAKRTSRGIAGHSMGGHGAIKIAMKHPELFCALYAMSPAWIDFSQTIQKPYTVNFKEAASTNVRNKFKNIHWRSKAIIALAAAVAPNPNVNPFFGELPLDTEGVRVQKTWQQWLKQDVSTTMLTKYGENLEKYQAFAIDCGTEEDLLPMNIALAATLRKAGIEHTFEKFEGGHIDCVASQLETKVLPLFSRTLKSDKEAAAVPIR